MMSNNNADFTPLGCKNCLENNPLDFEITMAFQPIVDVRKQTVFAYEALVRGKDGAGAGEVLAKVTDVNRYTFDQMCRIKAIDISSELNIQSKLSINFLPNAVYRPETCIRATLEIAQKTQFPLDKIIFEVTEAEPVRDTDHLKGIFKEYQKHGFNTAIDDFGAGYAGLNLLTEFTPNIIKLDIQLCRNIALNSSKQIITKGIVQIAKELNITVIAEGIEYIEDYKVLYDMGVNLFQGYLFSKPEIEKLPIPIIPKL
jgi:EAL domain-containing protein (putative c-di-GMP-specific phosphodiesterase class I)